MNTSLSIFARALASENLSFSFDEKAETASFDIKNRHLVMPVWKVSETVQTMLIAHEISHALWTPYERSEQLFDAAETEGYMVKLLQRIANVIEDVRIEKKMKDKFPGTRRDFFLGYKEINDGDLFGLNKMDLTKATLMNRINIHFKWGIPGFLPVQFDADEQVIVDAVTKCETFDDVFALAKILYDHPSMDSVKQEMKKQMMEGKQDGEGDVLKDAFMDTDLPGGIDNKDGTTMLSPTITIPEVKDLSKAIISTDRVLKKFEAQTQPLNIEGYRQFVRESDAFVRQLVAQFERRKAADEIRRERPKQTGQLNLDRLHQYRTHDDIFLSKIVKQDGKNHGIVFLLDLSGSMAHTLGDCFLQILQLTWFCEKAKIPFEVFGFTDIPEHAFDEQVIRDFEAWRIKNPMGFWNEFAQRYNPEVIGTDKTALQHHGARLVSLASSQDDAAKREKLLAYYYEAYVSNGRAHPHSLGGTPTVEAVAYASQFIRDWAKANNIQIPTLMVVTDGSPNGISTGDENGIYYIGQHGTLTVNNKITGTIHRIANREMTSCLSNEIVGMMLNALREKFNARLVGMFVGGNRLNEAQYHQFCLTAAERGKLKIQRFADITDTPRYKAASEVYKEEGCIVLHQDTFHGYDAYFLTKTPKVVKDEDAIADSGTFTKVKNTFIKTMAKRSVSRVFLTRYVDIVAGQPIRKDADKIYQASIQ